MSHRHQCPDCKTIWEHPSICFAENQSHACPCCGLKVDEEVRSTFIKYHGPEEPDIVFFGPHRPTKAIAKLFEALK